MQRLAEICIRRPIFASMIILALVVVGASTWLRLGVDRFPSVDLPTVSIRTSLPGASPEETESAVTQIIEEAVNSVAGITELRSISGQGSSFVIATFALERNIEEATQDVRDRVGAVVRRLPPGVQPPVISKLDNDTTPVLTVALAGQRSLRELTEIADKVARPLLERSDGVGEVTMEGGLERAIDIRVEADRLAAYGLPISAVREAIRRQNAEVPGGNVTSGDREEALRTMGRLQDARDFEDLVVARVGDTPVRLRDLGRAEDGTREQRSIVRLDGVPTVVLEVRRQAGANTVAVIEAAKANLDRIVGLLPPDVRLVPIRDQSRYIESALHEIDRHLVLGSILASLVVLVFMRSWRSTLIAAVAIPASVISTFGVMGALGFTLNSVTMLALVLMVGIVIDDAIVVLENIFRFVEEKGMGAFEAARAATAEIGTAVMATTFSLVVIFIPVSFMSSISGRFLYQFGITAAVSVLVSLLVSFTLTPAMSARMLRHADAAGGGTAGSRRGFYSRLDLGYARALEWALAHRGAVLVVAGLVVASSVPLYHVVRQEYIPGGVDEAEFDVNINAPQGASLAAMNSAMLEIEDELRGTPGVRLVLATTGGGFLGGVNQGRAYVRLAPHEERRFSIGRLARETLRGRPAAAFRGNRTQAEIMHDVRARLRRFSDLRVSVRNAPTFNIGGGNFEIDFVLRGPDLTVLAEQAEALRQRAPELGVIDADTTLRLDKPELQVVIDRPRAADLGVQIEEIAQALRVMVGGDQEVSRFRDPATNEDYDVQLRLEAEDRSSAETISRLLVAGEGGRLVRLDNLVRIEETRAASRIDRLDRQRQVSLRGQTAPGFGLADSLAALRAEVVGMNLPPAYSAAVAGRGREFERTFTEFIGAFVLSIVFMYMILAAQYESLLHPVTILLSLPLSVPFALLSLWGTGNSLNLYSALGILVLFGVVKKNAILQVDHTNRLRSEGMDRDAAIRQGNRDRLRPILMTTLALVAGMLPLAIGAGPGAEERRAVAVVVIGGQSLCLLLTLLVTPVAYAAFDDLAARLRGRESAARSPAGRPQDRIGTPVSAAVSSDRSR